MASCESGRRTLGPFIRICPVHHRGQAPDQVEIRRRPGRSSRESAEKLIRFLGPPFPNGVAHAMRPPLEPLFLDALDAAVRLPEVLHEADARALELVVGSLRPYRSLTSNRAG